MSRGYLIILWNALPADNLKINKSRGSVAAPGFFYAHTKRLEMMQGTNYGHKRRIHRTFCKAANQKMGKGPCHRRPATKNPHSRDHR
jgi:hypothetical protein